eukprot:gene3085-3550_t
MALLNIKKVLITDKIDPVCKNVFEKHGVEVDLKPGMPKSDILAEIKNYDCLIVRSATKVTADVIAAGKKLQVIGRAGTGVDNIDLSAASKNGIFVMNTPAGNTLSAAEHTCALIAALARNIGQGHASLKQGKWERSKFMGCELNGKTLAILGLGRIGREVALRMQSYGMKTIGFDPIVPKEEAAKYGIESLSLTEIWPQADFITVHTPLIPQTKGLLSHPTFKQCKDGVRVINVARGGIIDEADLLEALESGKVAGAGLDVFVSEPPKDVSEKLAMHPNVLCTPHLGASTIEAQKRVAMEIAEQIVDASKGESIVGLVNAPFLAEASKPELKTWLDLAQKLAIILHSCASGTKSIDIVASGNVLQNAKAMIAAGFAFGFAKQDNKDANLINSMELLKAAGISINWLEASEKKCCLSFSSTLKVFTEGPKGRISLVGSVFESTTPVLLCYNCKKFSNPVVLDKHLFIYHAAKLEEFFKTVADCNAGIGSLVSANVGNEVVVFGTFTSGDKSDETPACSNEKFSVGEGDEYQYNPCTPFSNGEDVGECHNVLGCQYVMVGAGPFAIAYKEPMVVDYDSSIKMYTFTYTGSLDSETKSKRKMVIQLKCNTDASNPSLEAFKEAPLSTFTSTLTSKYACVVGKANVSTGLSVGSIICIVLFAILFVYFVFGIILNKYAFHKEGTDVIPQKSFWADIPHLVKDGARFSYQKIKGNSGQYEQI